MLLFWIEVIIFLNKNNFKINKGEKEIFPLPLYCTHGHVFNMNILIQPRLQFLIQCIHFICSFFIFFNVSKTGHICSFQSLVTYTILHDYWPKVGTIVGYHWTLWCGHIKREAFISTFRSISTSLFIFHTKNQFSVCVFCIHRCGTS